MPRLPGHHVKPHPSRQRHLRVRVATSVQAVPVREVMFAAVLDVLQVLEVRDGRPSLVPVQDKYRSKFPEDVIAAVKQLVGYVELVGGEVGVRITGATGKKPATRAKRRSP